MPYIQISMSEKLDDKKIKSLRAMLGEKIAILPGKSEAVLMIQNGLLEDHSNRSKTLV